MTAKRHYNGVAVILRLRRMTRGCFAVMLFISAASSNSFASEVIEETRTQVIVREHPKTGQPYVSIVSADNPDPKDPFTGQRQKFSRPDYRLLDPKIKAKDIPYEGPYSSRKKVYVFAASIAAVGAAGGIAGLATAPAATGAAGASGGAGAYMAGAGAVAGTAAAASVHATTGTREPNFIHRSESKEKSGPHLDNPSSSQA